MSPLFARTRKAQIPGQARDDEGGTTTTVADGTPNVAKRTPNVAKRTTNVIPAKAGISAATICQAAALVLAYPEAELLDRLDVIETALIGGPAAEQFAPVLAHLRGETIPQPGDGSSEGHGRPAGLTASDPDELLSRLQAFHVQEFDLSRKHSLHLSYWTDGDTRRRGNVLAEVKQVYRESGLLTDTGGEMPDYLPMVLEFTAADPERGFGLLERFRASVELIRLGLAKDHLPHAGVLAAVCDLLPGTSPTTRAEVQSRFGEVHPIELVGLELVRS